MKKLFTLLLSCMVVFGLSACTNNNKDTGQSNPTKQTVHQHKQNNQLMKHSIRILKQH